MTFVFDPKKVHQNINDIQMTFSLVLLLTCLPDVTVREPNTKRPEYFRRPFGPVRA